MDQDKILEMAARAASQSQEPQGVQPSPVPMTIQVSVAQDMSGNKFVVLIVNHPVGTSVYHLHPDGAESISKALADTARLARTGLEIAR